MHILKETPVELISCREHDAPWAATNELVPMITPGSQVSALCHPCSIGDGALCPAEIRGPTPVMAAKHNSADRER